MMADSRREKHDVSSGHVQPAVPAFDTPVKPKRNRYAFACSFLASMTSILLGYDIGVMTGAIKYIRKNIDMTDVQEEVIMGILNLYSLLGAAAAGRTSDWIGRRYTIVLAGVIFVAGIGVGYALMIAPVYTAEVAPASSRGFLTSFPEVFINFETRGKTLEEMESSFGTFFRWRTTTRTLKDKKDESDDGQIQMEKGNIITR